MPTLLNEDLRTSCPCLSRINQIRGDHRSTDQTTGWMWDRRRGLFSAVSTPDGAPQSLAGQGAEKLAAVAWVWDDRFETRRDRGSGKRGERPGIRRAEAASQRAGVGYSLRAGIRGVRGGAGGGFAVHFSQRRTRLAAARLQRAALR